VGAESDAADSGRRLLITTAFSSAMANRGGKGSYPPSKSGDPRSPPFLLSPLSPYFFLRRCRLNPRPTQHSPDKTRWVSGSSASIE
uniref:Uncharacterized protein n=1 Tax=Aegilops tauschii subsp. strangulata TaxID=200361 RepID=A0A453PG71_AEGTS